MKKIALTSNANGTIHKVISDHLWTNMELSRYLGVNTFAECFNPAATSIKYDDLIPLELP